MDRYGPVGTRFSQILGTRIGSLKHLKKLLHYIDQGSGTFSVKGAMKPTYF